MALTPLRLSPASQPVYGRESFVPANLASVWAPGRVHKIIIDFPSDSIGRVEWVCAAPSSVVSLSQLRKALREQGWIEDFRKVCVSFVEMLYISYIKW